MKVNFEKSMKVNFEKSMKENFANFQHSNAHNHKNHSQQSAFKVKADFLCYNTQECRDWTIG